MHAVHSSAAVHVRCLLRSPHSLSYSPWRRIQSCQRRPDPNDRRGTLVRLTRRGRSVVNRAVETHVGNEERLLAALTAAARRTLDRLLRKLLSELERAEGNP
jgi:hypothetical protein